MGFAMDNARGNAEDKLVAADVLGEDVDNNVTSDNTVPSDQGLDSKPEDEENSSSYGNEDSSDTASLEKREDLEVREHPDSITKDTALGVQKAEAAALVWSKKAVYLTYAWIWVCYFMLALQQSISSNVISYAYASFQSAPQIATATVLAAIVGGVIKLPIAKTLNIWGRAEGFLVFVGVYLLGIIIIASCNNANSYAAGYVLYWIGYDAIYMILDIFIADTFGLKNRAFAFGFSTTPFICTAFTGPLAATAFIKHSTWRWANGAFAIIMPFVFVPLAIVFKFYQRKAEKMGLFKREKVNRTISQSIIHYAKEFDVIGALILMAAFVLVLLPFSLQTNARLTYKSAGFIVMEVLGWLLFPVFYLWERYGTTSYFVNWELLKKRTVLGAAILMAVLYFSFYCWNNYYYSFVMVEYSLDMADTGYMTQIYNVGSCFWGPIFGLIIRYTKHFKYPTFAGLLLLILGSGLMIRFRGDGQPIGLLIMSQIFVAFGGGSVVIGSDMAVMAAADHEGVPMMLSILGLSSSVGGAIGGAVAGAIYAYAFPKALTDNLPADSQDLVSTLYLGGYLVQLQYLVGTDVRTAINKAWAYSQKLGCIACTAILAVGIPAVLIWKNYNVDRKQNKGQVI